MTSGSVLVIIPTFNEAQSLPDVVAGVRSAVPKAHILIADDASPDGTGDLADHLASCDEHVHVLHRTGKHGLGAAYLAAFRWGLGRGFEVLVEMDADGSHRPRDLPRLIDALEHADLVIGSRWVPGGQVENWSASRELLSKAGNTYARMMLDVPVRDSTAGFRAFRAAALRAVDLDGVESQGYCFQVDLTRRVFQRGLRVTEVPITFVERRVGASKMSRAIVAEALWRVSVWGLQRRLVRRGGR